MDKGGGRVQALYFKCTQRQVAGYLLEQANPRRGSSSRVSKALPVKASENTENKDMINAVFLTNQASQCR